MSSPPPPGEGLTSPPDEVAEEIIKRINTKFPDYKPNRLSEYSFCQFELMENVAKNGDNMQLALIIARIILGVQFISCVLIIQLELHFKTAVENGSSGGTLYEFLYFMLNLRTYGDNELHSEVVYLTSALLMWCVILSYGIGMIYIHSRLKIPHGLNVFIVFSLLIIPIDGFILFGNICIKLFITALVDHDTRNLLKSFVLLLMFSFLARLHIFERKTIYNSFMFLKGSLISEDPFISLEASCIIILLIYHTVDTLFGLTAAAYCVSVTLILLGLFVLFDTSTRFFFTWTLFAMFMTSSCEMILVGITTALQAYGKVQDQGIVISVFLLSIAFFITISKAITNIHLNFRTKQLAAPSFEDMGIRTTREFVYVYITGFIQGADCVADGSLLKWGLDNYNEEISRVYLFIIGSLLHPNLPIMEKLKKQLLSSVQNLNQHRFFIYDLEKLSNLRLVNLQQDNVKNLVIDLSNAITSYRDAREVMNKLLSDDLSTNFAIVRSLERMKETISSYIDFLDKTYPNCIQVRYVVEQYYSFVEFDREAALKYQTKAGLLDNKDVYVANYDHIIPLERFPKMMSKLSEDRYASQTSIFEIHSMSNLKKMLPPYQPPPNEFFKNQKIKTKALFSFLSVIIMLASIFHLIFTVYYGSRTLDNLYDYSNILRAHVNSLILYSGTTAGGMYNIINVSGADFSAGTEHVTMFIDSMHDVRVSYLNMAENSKSFKQCFSWWDEPMFLEPTMLEGIEIYNEILVIVSRMLSIEKNLYLEAEEFNPTDPSIPILIAIFLRGDDYYSLMNKLFSDSSVKLLKIFENAARSNTKKITMFLIITLSMFNIFPLISLYETYKLSHLVKSDATVSTQSISRSLLAEKDLTLRYSLIMYYSALSIVILISLLVSYNWMNVISGIIEKIISHVYNSESVIKKFMYATNGLVAVMADRYKGFIPQMMRVDLHKKVMNASRIILSDTNFGTNISFATASLEFTNIAEELFKYIDEKGFVNRDSSLHSSLTLFHTSLIPYVEQYHQNITSDIINSLISTGNILGERNGFFFVCFIIYFVYLSRLIRPFIDIPQGLIMCITAMSRREIAKNKAVLKHIDESSEIAFFNYHKKGCMLDLLERPCCMIDKNNIVINCNRLWLSEYELTVDDVIGQVFKTSQTVYFQLQFDVIEVNSQYRLVIPKILQAETIINDQIQLTMQEVQMVRSSIIPHQYIEHRRGMINLPFIVCATIMFVPIISDHEMTEDWVQSLKLLLTYLSNSIKANYDADILYMSFREAMVILGPNTNESEQLLVVNTLTILSDLLRAIVETLLPGGSFYVTACVSCGRKSSLYLTGDHLTRVIPLGDAFQRQAELKYVVEPNSMVICDETASILQSTGYSYDFRTTERENIYIFTVEGDPVNIQNESFSQTSDDAKYSIPIYELHNPSAM